MTEIANGTTALIFMTARDCEMYVRQSLASLSRQTLDDLHVLFVDDCSQDDTGVIAASVLNDLFPNRHTFIRNDTQMGKSRNVWEHLRPLAHAADFIGILDGDDQLIIPTILEQMAQKYAGGKDVVWTNFITDGGGVGGNGPLDPNLSPRAQGWKTSHFFSFRASLLDNIPESYFRDNAGQWFMAACDIALALPILDQTRRYEYMPINAHCYTASNPYSHHNLDPNSRGLNSTSQQRSAQDAFNKPPLPVTRPVATTAAPKPAPVVFADNAAPDVSSIVVGTDVWQKTASDILVSGYPTLLDAQSVAGRNPLTPMQIWALRRAAFARSDKPNILHIGAPRSALALASLVAGQDIGLNCLCITPEQVADLDARFTASGLTDNISIIETEAANVGFEDISATFPDTRQIGADVKFELVVVDLQNTSYPTESALLALPALANNLSPFGFNLCLFAQDRATEVMAAKRWASVSAGLKFSLDAMGGSGLMVAGGR
ncbi:glycosyltransferase family 2 protein [Rhizobium sp. P38BS-XIX]|uniref:glycosyltransferase family 2 protein n=1 Tax=Rhizobium sp. P38BS-XIX TaxID=2726740 RepID=UPI001456E64D|nr:glycosyltransferase family 2 protein [Rhizobium sp. P38BS-XIX]NLR96404.1 glycosyltransferase family 2 protein [Rhizobium sp. P38BS-XIX]